MYKIPTTTELRTEVLYDNIIDKYCEIIGEEVKRLNKLGIRELRFLGEPESIYVNTKTNELLIVLSGKKEYAKNELYHKCNYDLYFNKVVQKFVEAGYEVKTQSNNRHCYSTELYW